MAAGHEDCVELNHAEAKDGFEIFEGEYEKPKFLPPGTLLILNKAWYDSLPAELQAVVLPKERKIEKQGRKGIRALTPLLLKNFETQGITVHTLTSGEKDAFKKATRPAWAERMSSATPLGKKLFEAIKAAKAAE